MEWRALSGNSVVDGQVSTSPIVRDAKPIVSNKIIWIHHLNDAEAEGSTSVSLQGIMSHFADGEEQPQRIFPGNQMIESSGYPEAVPTRRRPSHRQPRMICRRVSSG